MPAPTHPLRPNRMLLRILAAPRLAPCAPSKAQQAEHSIAHSPGEKRPHLPRPGVWGLAAGRSTAWVLPGYSSEAVLCGTVDALPAFVSIVLLWPIMESVLVSHGISWGRRKFPWFSVHFWQPSS